MEPDEDLRAIADMDLADPAAFERLFQAVYAYAARRVGETLSEDIAAETFARALAAVSVTTAARTHFRGCSASRPTCSAGTGAARSGA